MTTSSTGRSGSRTGTTCARTATRRTCRSTTTRRRIRSRHLGGDRRWAARPATDPVPRTSRGRTPQVTATPRRRRTASPCTSTNAGARSGESTLRPGNATRSKARGKDTEIDVCAQCHSRRGQFSNGYRRWRQAASDHYPPALLTAGLYYPDGQQRDEVYNWGSFLQSRMYSKGVTCSDCHEPHRSSLRAAGNAVCAQCHLPRRFDIAAHHFHEPGTRAPCAACHMPTTTYMVVDPRHDHSLRIPRPDQSETLGVPNACTQCHEDRSPAWAAESCGMRYPYPKTGFQDFSTAFASADRNEPDATIALAQLVAQPGRVRHRPGLGTRSPRATRGRQRDAVCGGGRSRIRAHWFATQPSACSTRAPASAPAGDTAAARGPGASRTHEGGTHTRTGPGGRAGCWRRRRAYSKAAAEYIAGERFDADRPENRTNLGGYYAERGQFAELRRRFASEQSRSIRRSCRRGSTSPTRCACRPARPTPKRRCARAWRARLRMRRCTTRSGCRWCGRSTLPDALPELREAVILAPDDARFSYVYAVALINSGKPQDARP